jgi:hypothetical protein
MTRDEQVTFVKDLITSVETKVLLHIERGEIPVEWDGLELRTYLKDLFVEAAHLVDMGRKRKHDYVNTIAIYNL